MTISVSELNRQIKQLIEPKFSFVEVQGEISNIRLQSSGHLYFTLKDDHSQIGVALFQAHCKKLIKQPKEGDHVIVRGEVSLYLPRGSYQLLGKEIEFLGVGHLLLKLHQLKEEIQQLGWFQREHKQPLPSMPKIIGVITSPTGAVIHDIIHVLKRRMKHFILRLYPVKVQGAGAKEEIAAAIETFNRYRWADVLIVGRGGGSIEDLFAFNEKIVAEAIFHSKIPIVSAVGHETDFTIADFVADVRAPTPSAAAEMISTEHKNLLDKVETAKKRMVDALLRPIRERRLLLDRINKDPFLRGIGWIAAYYQKLDTIYLELQKAAHRYFFYRKEILEHKGSQLHSFNPKRMVAEYRIRLNQLKEHLEAVNPIQILKRGYCIAFEKQNRSMISSTAELREGEEVELLFHDGTTGAHIHGIRRSL